MLSVSELDAAGFLPRPGESAEEFTARAEGILNCHAAFDEELKKEENLVIFDSITVSEDEKIDPQLLSDAGDITWELYRFRSVHVPGFFLSRSIGALWGGCLIGDPDLNFSVFLIRSSFRNRERWLFYRRTELFAHELCHSMRMDLHENTLEEHFAYQTSPSPLRRYLGNCFIRDLDAILFVLPALLLFASVIIRDFFFHALPVWPFWILALAYPAYLLLRNARSRKIVRRAEKKLLTFGIPFPLPILFRCSKAELHTIGSLENRQAFDRFRCEMEQKELRWKIINERFIQDTI